MALGKNIKKDKLIPSLAHAKKEVEQKPKKKKVAKSTKIKEKKIAPKKVRTKKLVVKELKSTDTTAIQSAQKTARDAESERQVENDKPEVEVVKKVSVEPVQSKEIEIPDVVFKRKKRVVPVQMMSQQEIDVRRRRKDKYDQDILALKGKVVQLIVFKIGEDRYALEIDNVKEIVPSQAVSKLPHAPTYIKGVTNIRGHVMVIIDLEEKFELFNVKNNDNQLKDYTLVIKNDRFRVGILVNEVPTTLKIQGDVIESSSGILSNTVLDETFIKGLIKQKEEMVILLDIVELIESNEVSEIALAVEDSN